MIRAAILSALVLSLSAADFSVLTSVASYHWKRRGQQEINPGIGLGIAMDLDGAWSGYAQGMIYDDSHGNTANYTIAGLRYGHRFGIDMGAGYHRSTHSEGIAVMPSLFAGTDRIHAHAGAIGVHAVGFWIRWDL